MLLEWICFYRVKRIGLTGRIDVRLISQRVRRLAYRRQYALRCVLRHAARGVGGRLYVGHRLRRTSISPIKIPSDDTEHYNDRD